MDMNQHDNPPRAQMSPEDPQRYAPAEKLEQRTEETPRDIAEEQTELTQKAEVLSAPEASSGENRQEAAPAEPTSAPAEPTQVPVEPAPGPAEPTQVPVEPAPGRAEAKPGSPYENSPYVRQAQPPIREKKKKRSGKGMKRAVIVLSAALVLTLAGGTAAMVAMQQHYGSQVTLMQHSFDKKIHSLEQKLQDHSDQVIGAAPASNGGLTPSQVYAKNVKAVVSVECEYEADEDGFATGGGSGFTITEDGYILTNSHVVEGAKEVVVRFHGGEVLPAEVVGSDASNDVALLKVDGEQLPVVEFGSSDALAVGDQVVVIGYPLFTTKPVLTGGYVSAKDQVISTEESRSINTIQIDAAINSGNSGGPVFNALGQVIGIAVAKESGTTPTGASIEGVGYTVPIDDALRILPDLREFGYVKSGFLGVMVRDVDFSAQSYGLPAGAFVTEPNPGEAAERAGVQPKDIITSVEGTQVASVGDLTRVLQRYKAGEEITITVWRNGETVYLNVILDERPQEPSGTKEEKNGDASENEWFDDFLRPFFEEKP